MGLMRVVFSGKGSVPTLERSIAMTEKRQVVLSQNLANVDTPDYLAKDINESGFKKALSEAVVNRNEFHPRRFEMNGTDHINVDSLTGSLEFEEYSPQDDSFMRHDGNNVSYENELSKIVQNGLAHRAYTKLISGSFNGLTKAITGRSA